jgi:hypothetical protein
MTAAAVLTGAAPAAAAPPASGASAVVAPATVVVTPTDGSAGAQPAPGSVDLAWLGADAPDDLKGYVQTKGWKGAREVLDGYRNLEKVVGQARLAMPKDENDVDGYAKVYDALGRPKSAAEYKLPVPEGADPTFAKAASDVFHKAGLSTKQAGDIGKWWNETAAAAEKAAEEKYQVDSAQAMQKLEASWGGAYKERLETASRAARQFAIDADMADRMERSLGTEKFMDLMYRMGHAISEHGGAAGLDQPGAGSHMLTPEQAKTEIKRLQADPEWSKKYINGGALERQRMESLHKMAFPGA